MKRATFSNGVVFVSLLIAGFIALPAYATVTQTGSGTSSAGNPVSFKAELTISGDILTVKLFNDPTNSLTSLAPNDLLSSYFFEIMDSGNNRPVLAYVSAVGDVWLTRKNSVDVLQTANANLKAVNPGDNTTWAFKTMNASLSPFLGFGIGTVGNNNLTPNNFNGNVVDGMDYSIYAGDVTTQNLHNKLFVKGMATFTFSGLTGFTEANIKPTGKIGLGTAPDNLMDVVVPEPATVLLLILGGMVLFRCRQR